MSKNLTVTLDGTPYSGRCQASTTLRDFLLDRGCPKVPTFAIADEGMEVLPQFVFAQAFDGRCFRTLEAQGRLETPALTPSELLAEAQPA